MKRTEEFTASQKLKMAQDTKCLPNMCVCVCEYNDKKELDAHMINAHTDPDTWKCDTCGKICNLKGHLWGHVRKHQGRYFHYCDVKYEDKDKIDEKTGKPTVVICDTAVDELPYIEYHRETVHNKGHTSLRCKHCDKPQMSVRRKNDHELVCKKGPTGEGELTHFCKVTGCDYKCRGKDTLCTHMKHDHPDLKGLPAPKRWICRKCQREYKSASGLRCHKCKAGPKSSTSQEGMFTSDTYISTICIQVFSYLSTNRMLFVIKIIQNAF